MLFVVVRSVFHADGRFILQRSFHVMSAIYLLRWITVPMTFLPNPNPQCHWAETHEVSLKEAILMVSDNFPPGACGNLIFSGHAAQLCLYAAVGFKFELWGQWHGWHDWRRTSLLYLVPLFLAVLGFVSVIGCRSHYTIDVVLAIIISLLTVDLCFLKFPTSKCMCWMEMRTLQNIKYEDVRSEKRGIVVDPGEQDTQTGLEGRGSVASSCGELATIQTTVRI